MRYNIKIFLSYIAEAFLAIILLIQVFRVMDGGMRDAVIGLVLLFVCVMGIKRLHQWRKFERDNRTNND